MIFNIKRYIRSSWIVTSCLFFALSLLSPLSGYADTTSANNWLVNQISAGNQIALDTDIANSSQSTNEAYITLRALGLIDPADIAPIKLSMLAVAPDSTETDARKILALALDSDDTSDLVPQLLTRYTLAQQFTPAQAGIGDFNYYDQNPFETAWALRGLAAANYNGPEVESMLGYLTANQLPGGGFGQLDTQQAQVYSATQGIRALQAYRARYDVEQPLDKAMGFLQALATSSGHWGDSHTNALVLLALLPSATDLTDYQAAIQAIENAQLANGSWDNDVYVTALAARVLHLAENFTVPTTITTGNVAGSVVNSITAQALAGVTITLSLAGQADVVIESDNNGNFLARDLEQGDYNALFELADFLPTPLQVTVNAETTVNIGQTSLTPLIGSVTGRITDADTGEAIANAAITLTGASTASTTTDADGQYFARVAPGTVTVAVSAANYQTVSGTGSVTAGSVLSFSPQLLAQGNPPPPDNVKADLFGVVVDRSTGDPILDAQVIVVGQSIVVQTDATGAFILPQLDEGTIEFTVSKQGYATNRYDLVVPKATNVDVGALTLAPQIDPSLSIISGEVFNSATNQPIENATLTLNTGEQVSTGVDGSFSFEDLPEGKYQITLGKEGYLFSQHDIHLPASTSLQMRRLFLKPRDAIPVSILQGQVTDETTGLPVSGAVVTIEESGQTTTSDADGNFEIIDINLFNYSVLTQAQGYWSRLLTVSLLETGTTQLPVVLEKASQNGFTIENTLTDQASYPAYAPVVFSANIRNESDVTQPINALFQIENSAGEVIHRVLFGDVVASQTGNEVLAIAPGTTELVNGQWYTGIQSPGEYTLVTSVFDDLSDRLLAEQSSRFTIAETKQLTKIDLDATPLFANVGEQTQVEFELTAANRSNVPYEVIIDYQWADPQGQAIVSTNQKIVFNPEELYKQLELDSFAFTFTQSGAYPTSLVISGGPRPSELNTDTINIAPSVRIESTQSIDPNQVTPDGDKRIKLGIKIKGVEQ